MPLLGRRHEFRSDRQAPRALGPPRPVRVWVSRRAASGSADDIARRRSQSGWRRPMRPTRTSTSLYASALADLRCDLRVKRPGEHDERSPPAAGSRARSCSGAPPIGVHSRVIVAQLHGSDRRRVEHIGIRIQYIDPALPGLFLDHEAGDVLRVGRSHIPVKRIAARWAAALSRSGSLPVAISRAPSTPTGRPSPARSRCCPLSRGRPCR